MYLTRNVLLKYLLPMLGGLMLYADGDGGQGGGGGGQGGQGGQGNDDPWKSIPAELKTVVEGLITKSVETQVAGLKTKNGELIATQKQLKAELEKYSGIDPEAVRTILQRFADDEEQGLIKAGKIDEVLAKRTERMQADFNKKLQAEQGKAEKLAAKAQKLAERATNEAIIKAAGKAGALSEAMEDIVLRAKGAGWTIDDEGNVVARNGEDVVFGKDGKTPLTPEEWVASLRENAPHLWPKAQGSGANGSNNPNVKGVDLSKLSPEARMTASRQGAAQR